MELTLFDLLSKEYFPKELPPPFTSSSYAEVLTDSNVSPYINTFSSPPKFSASCVHNLVRTGGLRRNLSIPNPKHFFHLANHIVDNWVNLKNCNDSSPFSLTKPICKDNKRAISPEHELSERVDFRAKLRSSNRFLLKADISRFFPSIYSHSIPWAVLGKQNAKKAHKNNTLKNSWCDKTDLFSRSISKSIRGPLSPNLIEQKIIVAEIENRLSVCDKLEESIEQSLSQAEALRQSILKKAFEGKLVPQDPSDEPASVLLERIRAERTNIAPVKKTRTSRGKN